MSPFFLSLHTFEPFCLFILAEVEKEEVSDDVKIVSKYTRVFEKQ
jgi:hypothetical protein